MALVFGKFAVALRENQSSSSTHSPGERSPSFRRTDWLPFAPSPPCRRQSLYLPLYASKQAPCHVALPAASSNGRPSWLRGFQSDEGITSHEFRSRRHSRVKLCLALQPLEDVLVGINFTANPHVKFCIPLAKHASESYKFSSKGHRIFRRISAISNDRSIQAPQVHRPMTGLANSGDES
jgi:hypothetical protein